MPRKKKETLVHLDLETLSKETGTKKTKTEENVDTSLGGTLRRAREKKKLSVAQIAKKLCIKEMYLDALEQGHYYVFPGLAYGVGFLRTYAKFLELDANEMVEKFQSETSAIKVEPIEMPIQQNANLMPSGRTIFKGIAALIVLYLVWYIVMSLTQEVQPANPTENPIIAEEVISEGQTNVDDAFEQTLDVQDEIVVSEVKTEEVAPVAVAEEKTAVIQQAPIIADAVVAKKSEPIQMKKASFGDKLWSKFTPSKVYGASKVGALSFVATEEVWVKVMQDDKVILEEILYKGDRYNVPADTDYTLTTANAGALTVYVNGKKTQTLGAKGALVENVTLNADNFN